MTARSGYMRPRVKDYGTLVDLTAHLDLNVVGSLAKVVTLAAVSTPVHPPGGGPAPNPPTGQTLGQTLAGTPGTPGTGGGGGALPGTTTSPTGGGGGVRHVASGGGGGGSGGGGGGGKLPFTGYVVMLTAGVGAALSSGGLLIRSKLRRGSDPV